MDLIFNSKGFNSSGKTTTCDWTLDQFKVFTSADFGCNLHKDVGFAVQIQNFEVIK